MRQRSPASGIQVDELTGRLLNEMQTRFPLIARPYQVIGAGLGLDEAETFARVSAASDAGLIRNLGGIFDAGALGYTSSLVAMKVAAEQLDHEAAVIGAHPGVSHNHSRRHEFNLWFTISVPVGSQLDTVISTLGWLARATAWRALPTLRLFKVGVAFDMTGRNAQVRSGPAYTQRERDRALHTPVSPEDVKFIRVAQRDWMHVLDPFQAIAGALEWPLELTLHKVRALHTSGHLRRFAIILNHRRAGFAANAMTAWRVPERDIERVGVLFASHTAVSHCSLRSPFEHWPYNILAVLHGRSPEELEGFAARLSVESGMAPPEILYTEAEFKKARTVYFAPEHAQWRDICEAAALASVTTGGSRC